MADAAEPATSRGRTLYVRAGRARFEKIGPNQWGYVDKPVYRHGPCSGTCSIVWGGHCAAAGKSPGEVYYPQSNGNRPEWGFYCCCGQCERVDGPNEPQQLSLDLGVGLLSTSHRWDATEAIDAKGRF
jgi:hypothetical protein